MRNLYVAARDSLVYLSAGLFRGVGLSDLSDERLGELKARASDSIGNFVGSNIRTIHRIGLSDLSDEQVERVARSYEKP